MTSYLPMIRDWFIDADAHISEPGDLWTSRLPAEYRDLAPRLQCDPETGIESWYVADPNPLFPVGFGAVAGWPEPFPAAPKTMAEVPPAAYEAKARLEYMDSVGIWATAVYPNVGGFGGQAFLGLQDAGADAGLRAGLQRLRDRMDLAGSPPFHSDHVHSLLGCGGFGEGDRALREARTQGGALHRCAPDPRHAPPGQQTQWDPIWAAASACDHAHQLPHRHGRASRTSSRRRASKPREWDARTATQRSRSSSRTAST